MAALPANVKMLAGSDAELKAVDFADGMDVEVFEKQLAEAIDSYADCEAVLVLQTLPAVRRTTAQRGFP